MTTRVDVVNEARSWIDTRWMHSQSLKGVGCDCIGLVTGVAFALGIMDARAEARNPVYNGYGRSPEPAILLQGADEYLDEIPVMHAWFGDIYLLRFETEPQHFGIISEVYPPHMIHAYAQARKVVENRIDELWASRILRAYSFRGIE